MHDSVTHRGGFTFHISHTTRQDITCQVEMENKFKGNGKVMRGREVLNGNVQPRKSNQGRIAIDCKIPLSPPNNPPNPRSHLRSVPMHANNVLKPLYTYRRVCTYTYTYMYIYIYYYY